MGGVIGGIETQSANISIPRARAELRICGRIETRKVLTVTEGTIAVPPTLS
jgi:hypothetical protein